MPVLQRVIVDTVGRRTRDDAVAVKPVYRAAIPDRRAALERLDIQHRSRLHLHLDMPRVLRREMFDVLVRETDHPLAALRDHPSAQEETQHKKQRRRDCIGHHQTVITHSRRLNSDDLRVTRHLAREIDHRDEDEQGTEHVHVIRNERQVIIQDDLLQRHLVLEEIVHLLRQVKHDGDRKNEHDRKEERAQKFLNNIVV